MACFHTVGAQGGGDGKIDHRLADVIAGVFFQAAAEFVQFVLRGMRTNQQAIATGLANRFDNQLVHISQCVGQPLRFCADMRIDAIQNRVFIQIITDNARHIGVDGFIIRHTGTQRVGNGDIPAAVSLDQSRHTKHAVWIEKPEGPETHHSGGDKWHGQAADQPRYA
ncbi:hypothetical protein Amal_01627 [Acetobacter malorum]|uniref:Uncharacterized protein n=1 Tax=Acetobacter malorum TaxID=178901 RepID=A0A177GA18_9PROT|nr:hypothetical protein Amal_01627 [Acetobacter malorum]